MDVCGFTSTQQKYSMLLAREVAGWLCGGNLQKSLKSLLPEGL